VGTRVRLTRSGGLAGLSMVAAVDLDDLPTATAAKVRTALANVDFDPPAPAPRSRPKAGPAWPGAADTYQYDLEVDDGKRRAITVHEPVPSPHIQALVDVLLPLAKPE
jgi:hypothetical protein